MTPLRWLLAEEPQPLESLHENGVPLWHSIPAFARAKDLESKADVKCTSFIISPTRDIPTHVLVLYWSYKLGLDTVCQGL